MPEQLPEIVQLSKIHFPKISPAYEELFKKHALSDYLLDENSENDIKNSDALSNTHKGLNQNGVKHKNNASPRNAVTIAQQMKILEEAFSFRLIDSAGPTELSQFRKLQKIWVDKKEVSLEAAHRHLKMERGRAWRLLANKTLFNKPNTPVTQLSHFSLRSLFHIIKNLYDQIDRLKQKIDSLKKCSENIVLAYLHNLNGTLLKMYDIALQELSLRLRSFDDFCSFYSDDLLRTYAQDPNHSDITTINLRIGELAYYPPIERENDKAIITNYLAAFLGDLLPALSETIHKNKFAGIHWIESHTISKKFQVFANLPWLKGKPPTKPTFFPNLRRGAMLRYELTSNWQQYVEIQFLKKKVENKLGNQPGLLVSNQSLQSAIVQLAFLEKNILFTKKSLSAIFQRKARKFFEEYETLAANTLEGFISSGIDELNQLNTEDRAFDGLVNKFFSIYPNKYPDIQNQWNLYKQNIKNKRLSKEISDFLSRDFSKRNSSFLIRDFRIIAEHSKKQHSLDEDPIKNIFKLVHNNTIAVDAFHDNIKKLAASLNQSRYNLTPEEESQLNSFHQQYAEIFNQPLIDNLSDSIVYTEDTAKQRLLSLFGESRARFQLKSPDEKVDAYGGQLIIAKGFRSFQCTEMGRDRLKNVLDRYIQNTHCFSKDHITPYVNYLSEKQAFSYYSKLFEQLINDQHWALLEKKLNVLHTLLLTGPILPEIQAALNVEIQRKLTHNVDKKDCEAILKLSTYLECLESHIILEPEIIDDAKRRLDVFDFEQIKMFFQPAPSSPMLSTASSPASGKKLSEAEQKSWIVEGQDRVHRNINTRRQIVTPIVVGEEKHSPSNIVYSEEKEPHPPKFRDFPRSRMGHSWLNRLRVESEWNPASQEILNHLEPTMAQNYRLKGLSALLQKICKHTIKFEERLLNDAEFDRLETQFLPFTSGDRYSSIQLYGADGLNALQEVLHQFFDSISQLNAFELFRAEKIIKLIGNKFFSSELPDNSIAIVLGWNKTELGRLVSTVELLFEQAETICNSLASADTLFINRHIKKINSMIDDMVNHSGLVQDEKLANSAYLNQHSSEIMWDEKSINYTHSSHCFFQQPTSSDAMVAPIFLTQKAKLIELIATLFTHIIKKSILNDQKCPSIENLLRFVLEYHQLLKEVPGESIKRVMYLVKVLVLLNKKKSLFSNVDNELIKKYQHKDSLSFIVQLVNALQIKEKKPEYFGKMQAAIKLLTNPTSPVSSNNFYFLTLKTLHSCITYGDLELSTLAQNLMDLYNEQPDNFKLQLFAKKEFSVSCKV